jgi:hypothetical protein
VNEVTIWDQNIVLPGLRPERHLTLQERFEEWLATSDGTLVYESILDRARRLRDRGWTHFGIAALWEAARYDRAIQVGPNAGFKLNNDFRSRMARLIMDAHPEFDGFFETRELKA